MEKTFDTPLRFTCIEGCGLCCSYKVKVERDEIKNIASVTDKKFLREEGNFMRKKNGYCIFLNGDKKCLIYSERPFQCKSYPFYVERGQIDVDLSCPGVGKGEAVEKSFWEEIERKSPSYHSMEERLPTITLPENGKELFSLLFTHPCTEKNEIFNDFLLIENSKGTHFSGEESLRSYSFSLKNNFVQIERKTYPLPNSEELKMEGKEVIYWYLSIWSKRKIFKDYVFLTSLLTGYNPHSLALALLKHLLKLILSLQKIFSLHWERDSSEEEFLKESIRALDGRLRENCKKVMVKIK
ncbi:YkgJ family cysteine cluster protein [Candidatus Calescamantes bacterium]|nr:YkgJ family cysteine cluster protein [Candidatus Calescamantes bacterium]